MPTWLLELGGTIAPIANGSALVLIVILFATDRILTKGQHERIVATLNVAHAEEIANLKAFHVTLVGVKDGAYSEMKEARDSEKDRADKATDMLGQSVDAIKLNTHVLASLGEAVGEGQQ